MTLFIIGLGLSDQLDVTLKGLESIKQCQHVYLENYTSKLNCSKEDLETLYKKEIILADRNSVENNAIEIITKAKEENVAFLVVGDIFSATTHHDLRLRAIKQSIEVKLIHNTSILTAVGDTGLDLYKFGRTTTICYPEENFKPESCYDIIKQNQANNLHTLCLLDIKSDKNKFMTVKEALDILLAIEQKRKHGIITHESLAIACAGLGGENQLITFSKVKDLLGFRSDDLQILIIPGKLHFVEEEVLELYK